MVSKAINYFNYLIIAILVIICGANIFIYEEWQTPINNRAIQYLATPSALFDSMSFGFKVLSIFIALGGIALFWKSYRLVLPQKMFPDNVSRWWGIALFPVLFLLALSIRGGLGVMPINESAVYYSAHSFCNHAATNPVWHLIHTQLEVKSTQNHYIVLPETEAKACVDSLLGQRITAMPEVLDLQGTSKPNVIFIVMESMTAQVIEELGGIKGVCPNLGRLIREGISFNNCYGSGYRTDQGIVSVLGGYPAQPDQSIVLLSEKAAQLNSVSGILKREQGYHTLFVYGGELTFANIGVWLRNQQFVKIISEEDFPETEITQRWGVDDMHMLNRTLLEINQLKEPFFATGLTLSLHPPFDVQYKSQWQGSSEAEQFLNTAAFADHAIGTFMEAASKQDWFERSIFVFVADHGSGNPNGVSGNEPLSRQLPLIFWSKMLQPSWQGRHIEHFGNHHDIPATLFSVLPFGHQQTAFPWSRNLLQTPENKSDFAYYTNENGIGWGNSEGIGFYRFNDGQWFQFQGSNSPKDVRNARAYLQVLYDDFLKK